MPTFGSPCMIKPLLDTVHDAGSPLLCILSHACLDEECRAFHLSSPNLCIP